jgi:proteasome lid subunit RPN8/RPN11
VVERLVFPRELQDQLIQHAQEGAPDEVCGILAGRDQTVERIYRVRNMAEEIDADSGVFRDRATGVAAAGQRRVHYYMDPKDQLHVYNEIDELGLDPVGYYHSHPQSEARPSSTDIRLATDTTTFYILISLTDNTAPAVRAWRILKDDPMAETGEALEVQLKA